MSITVKYQGMGKLVRWGLIMVLVVLIAPLVPYAILEASNKQSSEVYATQVSNPSIELWKDARQRDRKVVASTQMRSTDAGVLINSAGEDWRQYRMNELIPYSGYIFVAILLSIVIFWFVRGRVMIAAGRSGRNIPRFTINQRTAHWVVATTFVLLSLTGLVMLYGRFVLIPLLGPEGFSITAQVAKTIHDFTGPAFGIALIIQFCLFVRDNGFKLDVDLAWLKKGGGLFGKHASAGCYNAGEKIWFWIAMLGGGVIIYSGIMLDFPFFNQDRLALEFNHFLHTISAVIVLAVAFGHIYMGTAAMEGTFESMATGYCDENWAKEHHDLWYENMKSEGKVEKVEAGSSLKSSEQTP